MMVRKEKVIAELKELCDIWHVILENAHRLACTDETESAYIAAICEENIQNVSRLLKQLEE